MMSFAKNLDTRKLKYRHSTMVNFWLFACTLVYQFLVFFLKIERGILLPKESHKPPKKPSNYTPVTVKVTVRQ